MKTHADMLADEAAADPAFMERYERACREPMRPFWIIGSPGGRRGWEVWIGPVGLNATWPLSRPVMWSWGWWRPLLSRSTPRP